MTKNVVADYSERAVRAWVTRNRNLKRQGLLTRGGKPTAQLLEARHAQAMRAAATRRERQEAMLREQAKAERKARRLAKA